MQTTEQNPETTHTATSPNFWQKYQIRKKITSSINDAEESRYSHSE